MQDALAVELGDKREDEIYRPGEVVDATQGGKHVKRYLNQTIMKVLPGALEALCLEAVAKGAITLVQKEVTHTSKSKHAKHGKHKRERRGSLSGWIIATPHAQNNHWYIFFI